SGIALSTGNLVGRAMSWGLGGTALAGRGMWDALTGGTTTRWDRMARKVGYWPTRGLVAGGKATGTAVWRLVRGRNTLRRK
ncbi:MAG: hypothetical protein WCA12_01740, partial [Burkholderiales bacterium]